VVIKETMEIGSLKLHHRHCHKFIIDKKLSYHILIDFLHFTATRIFGVQQFPSICYMSLTVLMFYVSHQHVRHFSSFIYHITAGIGRALMV